MKKILLFGFLLMSLSVFSQTQLLDDFNRADNTVLGGNWVEGGNGDSEIAGNQLEINGPGSSGGTFAYQDVSALYSTVYNGQTSLYVWEFNMQQSRSNPSGLASGNYGVGFVLGGTDNDFKTGTGYAVLLGNSGTTDPVRLVAFNGGADGSATTIVSHSDFGTNHLSIGVTFDPTTNTWNLYVRNDGSSFMSPAGVTTSTSSVGSGINNTYTSNDLKYLGGYWAHATGTSDDAEFDNIYVPSLAPAPTSVQFSATAATITEGAGTISSTVCVDIINEDATNATTVEVALTGGSATNGTDINPMYTTQTLTFPAGSTMQQCISFTLEDDADDEGDETIEFTLQNPSGGNSAVLGTNTMFTVTIDDNDFVAPDVRINEIDTDTPGTDVDEFIELYSATGANLDGLVLVLFNGNGDTEYASYDLDGITIAAGGFHVICIAPNAAGYCNSTFTISGNSFQNGADAVALYLGNPGDISVPTTTNLIDALVYDTNDADDTGLLTGLGQTEQINENENNASDAQSIQRGSWFVAPPTPGAMNMPLPVELLNFRAKKQAETINLYWQTASETHNDRFEIEHSTDGQAFRQIGVVKGAYNSHVVLDYQFNDETPANGVNYYRLKQVDEDGAFEYSNVVSVIMSKEATILIRPNLVQNDLIVELAEAAERDILIEVFDLQGRSVLKDKIEYGATLTNLNLSELKSGSYFLQTANNGQVLMVKFVKM